MEVEGHVIKPGPTYLELFSPAVSSLLLLTTLNPTTTMDTEFSHFLEPLRCTPVWLTSSREEGRHWKRVLPLDLDWTEVQQLTSVIRARGWSHDVAAIAVIEEMKSSIVRALTCDPNLPPGIFISVSDVHLFVCLFVVDGQFPQEYQHTPVQLQTCRSGCDSKQGPHHSPSLHENSLGHHGQGRQE